MRPTPRCFCKPARPECPVCSKPDWSKVRGSNGQAARDRVVAGRLEARKS